MCGVDARGQPVPCAECEGRGVLDNPWNNPHHAGMRGGVAVLESYQNIEHGGVAQTHAIYPNGGPPLRQPYQPEAPEPLDPHMAHSWPLQVSEVVRQLERVSGVLMTHAEQHYQYAVVNLLAPTGLAAGTDLVNLGQNATETELGFNAKSIVVDNLSGYTLWLPGAARVVPPFTVGYVIQLFPSTRKLRLQVLSGTSAVAANVYCVATERSLEQAPAGVAALSTAGNINPSAAIPSASLQYVFAAGASIWAPVEDGNSMGDGDTGFNSVRVLQQVWNGGTWDKLRTPNIFKPQATVAIGAETTIWTPAAGKRFRLMGMAVVDSAATTITFRDNTAGTVIFVLNSAAGGAPAAIDLGNGILSGAANNVLTAQGGAAGNLIGTVWGTEE